MRQTCRWRVYMPSISVCLSLFCRKKTKATCVDWITHVMLSHCVTIITLTVHKSLQASSLYNHVRKSLVTWIAGPMMAQIERISLLYKSHSVFVQLIRLNQWFSFTRVILSFTRRWERSDSEWCDWISECVQLMYLVIMSCPFCFCFVLQETKEATYGLNKTGGPDDFWFLMQWGRSKVHRCPFPCAQFVLFLQLN
jgi:hypothetical protein